MTTKVTSIRGTILIVSLQYLAIAIIGFGTYGEFAALGALWWQHIGTINAHIVFYSTVALAILLGITLAAPIPGLLQVSRSLELKLEDGESLLWSGACRRVVGGRFSPYRMGKLFLTNKRLVWLNAPAGGWPADDVEIRSGEFRDIRFGQLNLPLSSITHRRVRAVAVTSTSGKSYQFFATGTAYDRMISHLQSFLPGNTA